MNIRSFLEKLIMGDSSGSTSSKNGGGTRKNRTDNFRVKRAEAETMPIDRLAGELESDLESGLSQKKAESVLRTHTGQVVFREVDTSFRYCVRDFIRSPLIWLYFCVLLVIAILNRDFIGWFGFSFFIIICSACVLMRKYALMCQKLLCAHDVPTSKVIRGGKLVYVSANRVVRGDIVLLSRGDIVPADMRIFSVGNNFAVSEKKSKNDAHGSVTQYKSSGDYVLSCGSLVISGEARGLVFAAGPFTRIYALEGGIGPGHPSALSSQYDTVKSKLQGFSFISLLCAFPLCFVGYLTLTLHASTNYGLSDIVPAVIAISASSLPQIVISYFMLFSAIRRVRASKNGNPQNSVTVKTDSAMDRLGNLSYVDCFDDTLLTCNSFIPAKICMLSGQPKIIDCSKPICDDDCVGFAEAFYLAGLALDDLKFTNRGIGTGSATLTDVAKEYVSLVGNLTSWSEISVDNVVQNVETVQVVHKPILQNDSRDDSHEDVEKDAYLFVGPCVSVKFKTGNTVRYRLTNDSRCIDICSAYGTSTDKNALYVFTDQCNREGASVCFLIASEKSDENTQARHKLLGIVSYYNAVPADNAQTLRQSRENGLRIRFFAEKTDNRTQYFLDKNGLAQSRQQPVSENSVVKVYECPFSVDGNSPSGTDANGSRAAFVCDFKNMSYVENRDKKTPLLFAFDGRNVSGFSDETTVWNQTDVGHTADSFCVRRADVIFKTPRPDNGSIGGIRKSVGIGRQNKRFFNSATRFLTVSVLTRTLLQIGVIAFGLGLLPALEILFFGSVLEFIGMLVLYKTVSHYPASEETAVPDVKTADKNKTTLPIPDLIATVFTVLALLVSGFAYQKTTASSLNQTVPWYALLFGISVFSAVILTDGTSMKFFERKRVSVSGIILLSSIWLSVFGAGLLNRLPPIPAIVGSVCSILVYVAVLLIARKAEGTLSIRQTSGYPKNRS